MERQNVERSTAVLRLPIEVLDEISSSLSQFEDLCLRVAFNQTTTEKFIVTAKTVLTTWRTSLMGGNLWRLNVIAKHAALRKYVETLHIEDDCSVIDPWQTTQMFSGCHIWPRYDNRSVLLDMIGLADLSAILKDSRLTPERIVIRDYAIAGHKLAPYPQDEYLREYGVRLRHDTSYIPNRDQQQALAAVTYSIIQQADLSISSIDHRRIEVPDGAPPTSIHFIFWPSTKVSVAQPRIEEVEIVFTPSQPEKHTNASLLKRACLRTTSCWIMDALSTAPLLETLELDFPIASSLLRALYPMHPMLIDGIPAKLTSFSMRGAYLPSGGWLLTAVENSESSLSDLRLFEVKFQDGSTWPIILASIGEKCTALSSFDVGLLLDSTSRRLLFPSGEELPAALPKTVELGYAEGPLQKTLTAEYEGLDAGAILAGLATLSSTKYE